MIFVRPSNSSVRPKISSKIGMVVLFTYDATFCEEVRGGRGVTI